MSYSKILQLATKFAHKSLITLDDIRFQDQKDMLNNFQQDFYRKLSKIINQLNGDIFVLKKRNFDSKMMKLLAKVNKDLIEIVRNLNQDNPYIITGNFINYVLGKPNGPIIDNLDFLAKHHINKTNEEFQIGPMLKHPEITSLDELKSLAQNLQNFMKEHPLIKAPEIKSGPANLEDNLKDVPAFLAGQEDVTNPGAKKR